MANVTIGQLTEATSVASDAMLEVETAGGLSRRITKGNLLGDVYQNQTIYLVDKLFTNDATNRRYNTIGGAMAAAPAGSLILVGPGTYNETVTVSQNNIILEGACQPQWDGSNLVGGTIIKGQVNCGSKTGVILRDFGIDLNGTSGVDGIGSSAGDVKVYRLYENITIRGGGGAALAHGVYGTGHNITMRNIRVMDCYHGIAVHGSYANINDIYLYRCTGTSLVIKAKNSIVVQNVNVVNVVIEGDTSAGNTYLAAGIDIQTANSTAMQGINIANVTAINCIISALYVHLGDGTGSINDVSVVNMVSVNNKDLPVLGDYRVETGSRIILTNCRSYSRQAGCIAFVRGTGGSPNDVYLFNCECDSSGAGQVSGAFQVQQVNGSMVTLGTLQPQILKLTHGGFLTIASGVITATASFHYVDTEGGAASDDLDTINGGSTGQILILQSASSSRTVVIKNGTGNIDCKADISLDKNRDAIALIYGNGNHWERFGFGDNL